MSAARKSILLMLFLVYFNSSTAITPTKKGLMIQASTWGGAGGPRVVDSYLQRICRDHHDPQKPGYIDYLVLQDVATANETSSDPLLTEILDVVLPYFPGGSGACNFEVAFVGTLDLQTPSSALNGLAFETYRQGMIIDYYREAILSRSLKVAKRLLEHVKASENPNVIFHWYITQEQFIDYLVNPKVLEGSIKYYTQHVRDLSSVMSPRAILWSPGFSGSLSKFSYGQQILMAVAMQTLAEEINKVADEVDPYFNGPLNLVIQDHVGAGVVTKEEAVDWMIWLRGLNLRLFDLRINAEQYKIGLNGQIQAGDATYVEALIEREKYYENQGFSLGPCWELRFWIQYQ